MTPPDNDSVGAPTAPAAAAPRRGWRRPVGWAILGVCVAVFAAVLVRNGNQIVAHEWHFVGWRLGVSTFLLGAAFMLLPVASGVLLASYGHRLPFPLMARLYFTAQMAKYLPGGGVWGVLGRSALYAARRIPLEVTAAAMFYEAILIIMASGVCGSFTVARVLPMRIAGPAVIILALGVTLLLVWPDLPLAILRRLRLPFLRRLPAVATGALRRAFAVYLLFWFVSGAAFHLLLTGSVGSVTVHPLYCMTIFPAAWTVGFLAVVTPGGLGVREGTMVFLLTGLLPAPVAVAFALLARFQWMACEGFAFALAWIWRRCSHD